MLGSRGREVVVKDLAMGGTRHPEDSLTWWRYRFVVIRSGVVRVIIR